MLRLMWTGPETAEITAGTKVKVLHHRREELANVECVYSDGGYRIKFCSLFERRNITREEILQVEALVRC